MQDVIRYVSISTARSMSAVTQLLLTATARVKLSPTSTTFSSSLSRAATFIMLETPATSHLSSTPATPHLLGTPATSHLSSTPATSHLSSTPATSHLLGTPTTSHLSSTPATFLTSGTPVISVSPKPSVSSSNIGSGNMESSFSVSTVGTVAGVGGSFLLAVIIVVLVMTVLLLVRRTKKKYSVSIDTDEHILQNPLYGDQGQASQSLCC